MARTLADMTPEERQQCRGMWAEWVCGDDQMVLVVIEEMHSIRDYAGCVIPGVRYVEIPRHRLRSLIPRPDLPRAWNPDGTPVKMSMEWGLAYSTSYDNYQEREIRLTGDDEDKIRRNLDNLRELERNRDSVRDVQLHTRHVTEWEATDE